MSKANPWYRWLPWNLIIQRMARAHGFLDPVLLLSQLQRFTQPAEVNEPVELLRAGAILHARGLINSRVIQHNLDWVWPYWVEQQFNPESTSFIPRAFSITHINLTHRNWTAIGLPDYPELPIIDPRGLLTPFFDSWSLDCWVIRENGSILLPSRTNASSQQLNIETGLSIVSRFAVDGLELSLRAWLEYRAEQVVCCCSIQVNSNTNDHLAIVLRPYNPEGISFVHQLKLANKLNQWTINDKEVIYFDKPITEQFISDYRHGDVYSQLKNLHNNRVRTQHTMAGSDSYQSYHCDIGMLTAAALFPIQAQQLKPVTLSIPLGESGKYYKTDNTKETNSHNKTGQNKPYKNESDQYWQIHLQSACRLSIPDKNMAFLYNAALRTLLLHSNEKIYPGPYTYKRFWYRDATFISYALLCCGLLKRIEQALDYFPKQQDRSGYFHSQEGEWDSNGQVLWIYSQFYQFTRQFKDKWKIALYKGARWLIKKRLPDHPDSPHAGLLPAGFSAEHLGPNDYYYWDDFWALAGLKEAQQLATVFNNQKEAQTLSEAANNYHTAIENSLEQVQHSLKQAVLPASPYRRLDAGAIGSLVCAYPLQLVKPYDARLMKTVDFILENCMVKQGFFQDMIHSGINPYLTLHIAQVLLRAEDPRCFDLIDAVAASASSTGQWPEAIHPHTGGGCMGDGQHVWAAAEWIMIIRNCFIREEGDKLILGAGIKPEWWQSGATLSFGPAPTRFGSISISIHLMQGQQQQTKHNCRYLSVQWNAKWHDKAPIIEINLPNCVPLSTSGDDINITIAELKS